MNPTEKGKTSDLPLLIDRNGEPPWIRDNQAAFVSFDPALDARPHAEWIGEICAGENSFCEQCGEKFAMWPPKAWADHLMTVHGDQLTIQARTGTSLMCADELNDCQSNFFAMMFQSRVSMRRRAWKLGYAAAVVVKDEGRIKLSN